jgi:hypothetical protein
MNKHAELLDLIIDRAPKLRAAGVSHVALDGASFSLVPQETAAAPVDDDGDGESPDPLNDPATFGRTKSVPGQRRDLEDPS